MEKRLLNVLLSWLEATGFQTRLHEDGQSMVLVRRKRGGFDAFAATQAVGHTVRELSDLRAQAYTLRDIARAGYAPEMQFIAGLPLWRGVGRLTLSRGGRPVHHIVGPTTWAEALGEAVRWSTEHAPTDALARAGGDA